MNGIKLGDTAQDSVTGFEGTVIGITQWLGEPERVTLTALDKTTGLPAEVHFTSGRLEVISEA